MKIKFLSAMIVGFIVLNVRSERTDEIPKVIDPGDWNVSAGWSITFNPIEGGNVEDDGFRVSILKYKGANSSVTIPSGFWVK